MMMKPLLLLRGNADFDETIDEDNSPGTGARIHPSPCCRYTRVLALL